MNSDKVKCGPSFATKEEYYTMMSSLHPFICKNNCSQDAEAYYAETLQHVINFAATECVLYNITKTDLERFIYIKKMLELYTNFKLSIDNENFEYMVERLIFCVDLMIEFIKLSLEPDQEELDNFYKHNEKHSESLDCIEYILNMKKKELDPNKILTNKKGTLYNTAINIINANIASAAYYLSYVVGVYIDIVSSNSYFIDSIVEGKEKI